LLFDFYLLQTSIHNSQKSKPCFSTPINALLACKQVSRRLLSIPNIQNTKNVEDVEKDTRHV